MAPMVAVLVAAILLATTPAHAQSLPAPSNQGPTAGAAQPSRPIGRVLYASPNGDGTGASPESPLRIADFWPLARPGDTLLLLDGIYRGARSMIVPPAGLSGLPGAPITIRALHDGGVLLDGQGARVPVEVRRCDWLVLEGFNACRAGPDHTAQAVVRLNRSKDCQVRRVCAWDAGGGNTVVFTVNDGEHNLLEDCAGWGYGRKIFSCSQGGNHTTFRRCFGRWEASVYTGPKMTFSATYNTYHNLYENCIGTWDASTGKMPQTYALLAYDGTPYTGSGGGVYTNYAVNQGYGIISAEGYDVGQPFDADTRMLGCIAYLQSSQQASGFPGLFFATHTSGLTLTNCSAFREPGCTGVYNSTAAMSDFYLANNTYDTAGTQDLAVSLCTGVANARVIQSEWVQTDLLYSTETLDILNQVGGLGATIQKRYVDGVLTVDDLWPWPMDQRIYDAMVLGGYDHPVHVTDTIRLLDTAAEQTTAPADR